MRYRFEPGFAESLCLPYNTEEFLSLGSELDAAVLGAPAGGGGGGGGGGSDDGNTDRNAFLRALFQDADEDGSGDLDVMEVVMLVGPGFWVLGFGFWVRI